MMHSSHILKSTTIVLALLLFLESSFVSHQLYFSGISNLRQSPFPNDIHSHVKNKFLFVSANTKFEAAQHLTRRQAAINFIAGLQLPAGGFVMWLDSSEEEEGILQAVEALRALVPLQGLSAINREKLIEFIAKRQTSSGGFVSSLDYSGEIPEIGDAYSVAYILAHLNAFDAINKTALLNWILSCYHPEDGRFTLFSKNDKPDVYKDDYGVFDTVTGVLALYWMKDLDKINLEKTIEYILSCYQSDGGFSGSIHDSTSSYPDTEWCIRALYRLNALDRINREKTINYILQFYNATSQTFIAPGLPLTSAYRGTVMLGMLHATDRINTTKIIDLVLSCQSNLHGGFTITPDKNNTRWYKESVEATRLAVEMLDAVGAINRLDEPFSVLYKPEWYGRPYIPQSSSGSNSNQGNTKLDPIAVAGNLLIFGFSLVFFSIIYREYKKKKRLKKLKRLKKKYERRRN